MRLPSRANIRRPAHCSEHLREETVERLARVTAKPGEPMEFLIDDVGVRGSCILHGLNDGVLIDTLLHIAGITQADVIVRTGHQSDPVTKRKDVRPVVPDLGQQIYRGFQHFLFRCHRQPSVSVSPDRKNDELWACHATRRMLFGLSASNPPSYGRPMWPRAVRAGPKGRIGWRFKQVSGGAPWVPEPRHRTPSQCQSTDEWRPGRCRGRLPA